MAILTELQPVLGERLTEDLLERQLYARDLAPLPALLVWPFFRTLPDAVARPRSAEELGQILRLAAAERMPVTPRAGATTSFLNAVPVRGGLVLDLNDMHGWLSLDEDRGTVTVQAATRWWELDDRLRVQGWAVRSYPSSAIAATVGGWVSTQGYGIGSLSYGPLSDQLVRAQVALPDGRVHTATPESDPPLSWFVAAEGTLGVLTEVELAIRPRPAVESHHLLAFDTPGTLQEAIQALARAEPRPYTLFFADEGYQELLDRAGFPPPSRGPMLLVSYQDKAVEVDKGRAGLTALAGRELADDLALEEWTARFFHLRVKRAGPSLIAAELLLPLEALAGYISATQELGQRGRWLMGTYGLVVSPSRALVMTVYTADERRTWSYLMALGLTKRLYDLGARYGGRPYGVGLWNTPYLSRLFTPGQLAELRARKARLDPRGIMNPGKLYRAPWPLWPAIFAPAAEALVLSAHFRALATRKSRVNKSLHETHTTA